MIDNDGKVEYLPQKVPLNESASEDPIRWIGFRVADILLHQLQPDRFTLFVSHHYFAGVCVEFRISSTSLHIDDTNITLSGQWKTEFVANPCIDSNIFNFAHRGRIQAGGRMLMDGPGHLLLVTGDRAFYDWYQEEHPLEPPQPLRQTPTLASCCVSNWQTERLKRSPAASVIHKVSPGMRTIDYGRLNTGRKAATNSII